MEPALYGPSVERLGLVTRNVRGTLTGCGPYGKTLASQMDRKLSGHPLYGKMPRLRRIPRRTVGAWTSALFLDNVPQHECDTLRRLLFAIEPLPDPAGEQRGFSLLLLLELAASTDAFDADDVEFALAAGEDLAGTQAAWDDRLRETALSWRILSLLNILRYVSELSVYALRQRIDDAGAPGTPAQAIAEKLAVASSGVVGAAGEVKTVRALAGRATRGRMRRIWATKIAEQTAEPNLADAVVLAAWASREIGRGADHMRANHCAQRGGDIGCSLADYAKDLDALRDGPLGDAVRWLVLDQTLARHYGTAAAKIRERDTNRIL